MQQRGPTFALITLIQLISLLVITFYAPTPLIASKLDNVNVQRRLHHPLQFAGYYVAIEKTINTLPIEEKNSLNMKVHHGVDWSYIIKFTITGAFFISLTIVAFLIWTQRLRSEIKRRKKAEEELHRYQEELEKLVKERTNDLNLSNKQLTASERMFKIIFNNTYQFISLLAPHGALLECNNTSLEFIGKESKDVVGKLYWQTPWWSHSEELQNDIKHHIGAAASGEFINTDVILIDLQGNKHYVNFSLKPILEEDGQIQHILAEGRDISDQKRSEIRYETLFNGASDAILVMKDDRFIQCNDKALQLFQCNEADLLETAPYELSPPFQPDGRASQESALEKIKTAYIGTPITFEWQHCRHNGTPFDAEVSLNVIEIENEQFIQAIVRDTTERKNSEKQLSRMVLAIEQAAESIVIADQKGIIEYVNPSFEKTTGYSRAEALGNPLAFCRSGKEDKRFHKDLWSTIQAGKIWQGRFTITSKSGAPIVEDATISPVFDTKGINMGYVAVTRDMTSHIKLEADLQQAQKMEAIGTLAGGIAHDFNNILTAIFGYTELANLHLNNQEKLTHDLKEVGKAADRAKDLVTQILTFSRKTEKTNSPTQMALIVKEIIKMLRSSIPSTIEIKQQIQASDQKVLADPTQIHQILMNLCTNAYQAMLAHGGILGVALREIEIRHHDRVIGIDLPPGHYLELEVSDTGPGMDDATKEKIFDPYFTTKAVGQGTGLGLAVVHGIVKDHHGAINVYTEQGNGTTFRVYLPTIESSGVNDKQTPRQPDVDQTNKHILFVDDEEIILKIAQEVLQTYGYKVTIYDKPHKALKAYEQDPSEFDMLVTDMTMPQMTGIELAGKIFDHDPNFPIIICTGYSELINKESALAMGIREYLSKPMVMTDLVTTISEIFKDMP